MDSKHINNISQRIYVPRLIGYILGFILLCVTFYQYNARIIYWIYIISVSLSWPHLAYFIATHSNNQKKAEFRNLTIDAFLMGMTLPMMSFRLLPSITIAGMSLLTSIAAGGFSFLIRGVSFFILGAVILIPFIGLHIIPESTLLIEIFCLPPLIIYSMAIASATFSLAKKYDKARASIASQKVKLEDAYKEIENKNHLLENLSEKLSKYLSPQVYHSIFSGQKDVKIETYRKKLTVFFSDIVNFTEITDSMESEAITNILNHYFTEMSEIALKHGGTIDKFIGDAIMIFFGDPETKGEKEDALACVRMAIEMREKMEKLQNKWDEQGVSKPFRIRMGINSGYCTVGNFGSDSRLDYTIIGGQVNLASRLESHAGTDQILISHETYSLVKDQIACEKKDQIKVKGIAYLVQTYQVIGLHDEIGRDEMLYKKEESGFNVSIDFSKKSKYQVIEFLKRTISDIETDKHKVK